EASTKTIAGRGGNQQRLAEPARPSRTPRIPRTAVAPSGTSAYDAAVSLTIPSALAASTENPTLPLGMTNQRFDEQFAAIIDLAAKLCAQTEAGSLLVMVEGHTNWEQLRERTGDLQIVVAADTADELAGAEEAGLATIVLNMADSPVIERLTQALLAGV